MKKLSCGIIAMAICLGAAGAFAAEEEWIQLFNGKDLSGWTVKIRTYEAGENFGNTFRVEDGAIKVRYDAYDEFKERFGHLFYNEPLGSCRLRVEYRFVGEQVKGGPGWAYANSGLMVLGQSVASMGKDQNFPVSIEVQLLGDDGSGKRPTCNLCTPGTNFVKDGELITRHCTSSASKTYPLGEWVTAEVIIKKGKITHLVNGEEVMTYEDPQLDPNDGDAKKLLAAGQPLLLTEGTLSLQSESHPVEFRKVEMLPLQD